jgi:hypothetical protein
MLHRGGPVSRQDLIEPVDSLIIYAGEHVGEPGLRIDVVELAVWISVNMTAARSPPRSDPANSHDLLPSAIPRRSRLRKPCRGARRSSRQR